MLRIFAILFLGMALIAFAPAGLPMSSSPPTGIRTVGGTIKGKVTLQSAARGDDAVKQFLLLNHYAISKALQLEEKPGSGKRKEIPLTERAVVFIENPKLDRESYEVPARRPSMDQKDLMFRPQVLPILIGTTVDFPNHDPLFHNVFSYSQSREFDLGRYPMGDSRSVRFDKPGIVSVYCEIHAHMNAIILVLKHPYFSTPDGNGDYVIANVPEGSYTVNFWYGREIAERKTVIVKAGETTTLDFEI